MARNTKKQQIDTKLIKVVQAVTAPPIQRDEEPFRSLKVKYLKQREEDYVNGLDLVQVFNKTG